MDEKLEILDRIYDTPMDDKIMAHAFRGDGSGLQPLVLDWVSEWEGHEARRAFGYAATPILHFPLRVIMNLDNRVATREPDEDSLSVFDRLIYPTPEPNVFKWARFAYWVEFGFNGGMIILVEDYNALSFLLAREFKTLIEDYYTFTRRMEEGGSHAPP